MPSDDDRMSNIVGSMHKLAANYVHLTPTVARLIDPSKLKQLETLQFSGERLTADDVARWDVDSINTYGCV